MKEEWKPVVGWEESHEVYSMGRVRSIDKEITTAHGVKRRYRGRVLTPYLLEYKNQGYSRAFVKIGHRGEKETLLVHRLVAEAFCNKPDGCDVVNHIDCNPMNNAAANLEWTTHKGNSEHAVASGRQHANKPLGSRKGAAKLTEDDVELIIRRLCCKDEQKTIARDYGVAAPIISNINRGIAWSHVRIKECGIPPYYLKRPIEKPGSDC